MKASHEILIVKYLENTLSEKERKQFNFLCTSHSITEDDINTFKAIIEGSQQVSTPNFEVPENFKPTVQVIGISHRKRMLKLGKIAALVVLGIVIGIVAMRISLQTKNQYLHVETKQGDKIHVTLPDNNQIWLNGRSEIRYHASFTGTNRVIELSGEAYCSFPEMQNTPVIIATNRTQIICYQGKFNIESDTVTKTTEIEVEEGWVSVIHPEIKDRQFVVEAGYKGTLNELIPIWVEKNTNPNYLAWHTQQIHFNNTTLGNVAKTLSEVYDTDIDVKGDLQYCFYTGDFEHAPLQEILTKIKSTFQSNIVTTNGKVIITGKPC